MSRCLATLGWGVFVSWVKPSPRRGLFVALGLVGLAACGRARPKPEQTALSASARTAAVPSAGAAPSAAPSVTASNTPAPHPEAVLMAWNGALDRHAVEQLRPLYAAHVLFYGQRWSAEQVLDAKRKALAKDPTFRQRISGVKVSQKDDRIVVTFEKRSGTELKSHVYGSIVLAGEAGRLKIVEESDETTDAKFRPEADTCPEAALTIANSQPRIQADIERVAREYPEVNSGGLSNDQTDHTDRYSGSMGYFHPDHYEPRWLIDAADGKLTIRDLDIGPLPLTPAQEALVKRLCTGKADEPDADPQR